MIPTPADSNAWGARVALTSGVSLNETIAVPKAMMKLTKHHDRLALTPNGARRKADPSAKSKREEPSRRARTTANVSHADQAETGHAPARPEPAGSMGCPRSRPAAPSSHPDRPV